MSDNIRENEIESDILHDVDLSGSNTLGVHALASRFTHIKHVSQLAELYKKGVLRETDIFILGGGSNVLFADRVDRLLLKIEIEGIEVTDQTDHHVTIRAGAGENWHKLVSWCVEKDFGGIENLALIPGTTGAAPVQNIGAYGVELEQVFHSLQAFDISNGELKTFTRENCEFAYRDSFFKRKFHNRFIITHVDLKLTKKDHLIECSYHALREHLNHKNISTPGISDIYKAVIEIRKSKLPDPSDIGNAGSFFKNPVIPTGEFTILQNNFPDIPSYHIEENKIKIPAAWLIERAGWKGKRLGNVGTYENQALVIVNHGGATGREIYEHAMHIRTSVKKIFGIELVPEVNLVGKF